MCALVTGVQACALPIYHRRRAGRRRLREGGAQHAAGRRAAAAGRQCVRHSAPRHSGVDKGRGGSVGGTTEMSRARARKGKPATVTAERMYEVLRRPVVAEQETPGTEHNKGHYVVQLGGRKAEQQAAGGWTGRTIGTERE